MLRSDLESAGRMVENQFLQIRIGSLVHEAVFRQEQVISDTAADVRVPDSLDRSDIVIEFQNPRMASVHIRARSREKTRFAPAHVT